MKKKSAAIFDLKKLRKDPVLIKIFNDLKDGSYTVDKSILAELQGYTVINKKKMGSTFISKKEIADLNEVILQVQSYKDRITEVRIPIMKINAKLKRRYDEAVAYLWSQHLTLFKELKTESARKSVISQIIAPLTRKITQVTLALDICENVQTNLTSSSFALKEIVALVTTSLSLTQRNNL